MRARWLLLVLLAGASSLGGCKDEPTSEPNVPTEPAGGAGAPSAYTIVPYDAWTAVERDADPFVTDASVVPTCSGPGFYPEPDLSWLEIDTGECSWVTIEAAAAVPVEKQDSLRLVVSHYDLTAPQPARAELDLRFGDCKVWSKTVEIPGAAAVYTEEVKSPCSSAEGDSVFFHLHNHGQNTWQLQELSVLR